MYIQRCGNIEPITGHFDLFSSLLSCSPYTLYTALFQFTGHSLDLSDNVLHDWLFPHHCIYIYIIYNRVGIPYIILYKLAIQHAHVSRLSGCSEP